MRYLSLCSGIEAASVAWGPLGWEPVAFSEIEKFPCKLLEYRFPQVPNIGDMTKIDGRKYRGTVDLVVGGTPCQDFSIAGKRAGLNGERSGLAHHFIRLINEISPKFFIWENVPGCLTTNSGEDFRLLMDAFQNAGYFLDADILDAQFFGVPQRRRRVFVCGFNVGLLQKKTIFSAITIAKYLQEILGKFLEGLKLKSEKELARLASQNPLNDGLRRKMHWLLKHGTSMEGSIIWRNVLIEVFQKLVREQKNLVCIRGDINLSERQEGLLMDLLMEFLSGLTEESLKKSLDESFYIMKSFTTSTETKTTTRQAIYIFSQAFLNMQKLICLLHLCCLDYCPKGQLDSTQLQVFMNYARQTTRTLLGDVKHHDYWCNFIRQAEHINNFIIHIRRNNSAAAVLFEREGLRRDFEKGRSSGENYPCLTSKGAQALDDRTSFCLEKEGPRRLTPLEWERLQGFPDGWTDIPGASDTARYKAIGNSMAIPVMRWLGDRIDKVNKANFS